MTCFRFRPQPSACVVALLAAAALCSCKKPAAAGPQTAAIAQTVPQKIAAPAPSKAGRAEMAPEVRALLHDPDAASREARLLLWADGIASDDMPAELDRIGRLDSPEQRAALRRALLFSWTGRDLVAVARWVGTIGPAHDLQQEGREQLVQALLQCDPATVVPALQASLPATTASQLYGPYFRGWARTSPAEAGGMLAGLAAAEPGNPGQWNDLLAQVSAQWAAAAPAVAIAWVKGLPEGAGKSAALLQTSYRWVETDPVGAAGYAAKSADIRFIKAVAGKWAETAPGAALAWAQTLPEGSARTEALCGAAAIWAQKDPAAAAGYAASLGDTAARAEVSSVAAAAWAAVDASAAGEWVKTLPAGVSRDFALGALCTSLCATSPDRSFALAAGIGAEPMRNQTMENAAAAWLQADRAAAKSAIAGSALPAGIKERLLARSAL